MQNIGLITHLYFNTVIEKRLRYTVGKLGDYYNMMGTKYRFAYVMSIIRNITNYGFSICTVFFDNCMVVTLSRIM